MNTRQPANVESNGRLGRVSAATRVALIWRKYVNSVSEAQAAVSSPAHAQRCHTTVRLVSHHAGGAGRNFLDLPSALFHSASESFAVPTNWLVNIDSVFGNVFTPM